MQPITYLFVILLLAHTGLTANGEGNNSISRNEIIRVIEPGVFDYQHSDFLIRMRLWGISFPGKEQPGFKRALQFCEDKLLGTDVSISVKKEFDLKNLKLVDVYLKAEKQSLNLLCLRQGLGWHNETETFRHGPFVLGQIRARRSELGIWGNGYVYENENQAPTSPLLPRVMGVSPIFSGLKYWVTSFGKVHRPDCSFYQRGRGELTNRPRGDDCRICGGFKGKD